MKVSNCCSAPFIIGYKEDGERCSACKEHCGEEVTTNKILLFIGPSGSGKTTALRSITASMPDTFEYIPSLTTRPPRDNDPEEVWAYTFTDEEAFLASDLLQQTTYNGHHYGTLRRDFDNAIQDNKIPTLAVTEDGVQHFIDNNFFPIIFRLSPYNFTGRPGREAADTSRPPLPPSGPYSLTHITFDWSLPAHKRQAQMLSIIYQRIIQLF